MPIINPIIEKETITNFGPGRARALVTKERYSFPILPDVQPIKAILFVLRQRHIIPENAANLHATVFYDGNKDSHQLHITFTTGKGITQHTIKVYTPEDI